MYTHICVLHVHVCVVVCTCALVCVRSCVSVPSERWIQIYKLLSVITQAQNNTHTVPAIANVFLVTCLQLTQCDVTVCTYNVVLI